MFGRRRKGREQELEQAEGTEELVDGVDGVDEPEESAPPAVPARPTGPWDVSDAPDDAVDRVDLGGLRIPVPADTEVRVDVGTAGEVVAATLVQGGSAMQVNAFAAPRTVGIWDEVREEIGTSLRAGGGAAEDVDGAWGPELQATVPTAVEGVVSFVPARFIGVDGPRWFLRALLTGPAATDRSAASGLETALRDVLVVRGTDPMAVRDPLVLRLPKDVTAGQQPGTQPTGEQPTGEQPTGEQPAEDQPADAPSERPVLAAPERGPEITEVR